MGACFGILQPALLHQFVYIYPKNPDSGGDIWANFIKILLNIMVVAQIVLVGLMGIKEGVIAAPLMFRTYIQVSEFIFLTDTLLSFDYHHYPLQYLRSKGALPRCSEPPVV